MSEKTTTRFHEAKSGLDSALRDYKEAAEMDGRNMEEEILDSIFDVFGKPFLNELADQITLIY